MPGFSTKVSSVAWKITCNAFSRHGKEVAPAKIAFREFSGQSVLKPPEPPGSLFDEQNDRHESNSLWMSSTLAYQLPSLVTITSSTNTTRPNLASGSKPRA